MNPYLRSGLVCLLISSLGVAKWLGRNGKTLADVSALMWVVIFLIPFLATLVVGTFAKRANVPWKWPKMILASFLGWLLVAGILIGSGYAYLRHSEGDVDQRLDQLMTLHAGDAVERAKTEFSVTLNYTPASLAELERLLEQLHQRHITNAIDERTLGLESRLWGAYIGEIFKRSTPAEWKRDSAAGGSASFPLSFKNGSEFFPCAWAWKRIVNGEEDNVQFKFAVAVKSLAGVGASITNMAGVLVVEP